MSGLPQGLTVNESIRTKTLSLSRIGLTPVTPGALQNSAVSIALVLLFLERAASILVPRTEVWGP